jgi:hypothetical protein
MHLIWLLLSALVSEVVPLLYFRKTSSRAIFVSVQSSIGTEIQQRSTSKGRVSEWEREVRLAINERDFDSVASKLRELNSSFLPNGHSAIFTITETCRRSQNIDKVVPLLKEISLEALRLVEDDLMPLLSECAKSGNMQPAQQLVTWAEDRKPQALTAKTYSVLLKGYARYLSL